MFRRFIQLKLYKPVLNFELPAFTLAFQRRHLLFMFDITQLSGQYLICKKKKFNENVSVCLFADFFEGFNMVKAVDSV